MSDRRAKAGLNQNLSAAALAALFVVMAVVFVYQTNAFNTVRGPSSNYLLASLKGREGGAREALTIPSPDTLAVALKSQPLNPVSVNAALFAEVARKPGSAPSRDKIELLDQLGWRSTTALQNRIFDAVERQDLDQIVAIADALLRREELVDQGRSLMNLMELAPSTRNQLADALALKPSWRVPYFQNPSQPKGRQAVGARAVLAKALGERGTPMTRAELYSTLGLLADNGYSQQAYDLWLTYRNQKPALLNDPKLRWAYQMRNDVHAGIPFEWRLLTGSGFWSELVDDNGTIGLTINWDRKGVPYFAAQRTFLGDNPGKLVLQVDGVNMPATLPDDLSFVLNCPRGTVYFDQVLRKGKGRYLLGTRDPLTCSDPQFGIAGRPLRTDSNLGRSPVVGGTEGLSVTLTGLTLRASAN